MSKSGCLREVSVIEELVVELNDRGERGKTDQRGMTDHRHFSHNKLYFNIFAFANE